MRMERDPLSNAIAKTNIHKVIVGYLKLLQAFNHDFYTLLRENKINGRLFYNTCMPGMREIKYGNEDFLQEAFKAAIDDLLIPFNNVSLSQVKAESSKPTEISANMHAVINVLMQHIETSRDWKKFWEEEINLKASDPDKKQLYNMIAGAAAYKALVSCIDHSNYILDPLVKRNVALLVRDCTSTYHSNYLKESSEFHIQTRVVSHKKPVHTVSNEMTAFNPTVNTKLAHARNRIKPRY